MKRFLLLSALLLAGCATPYDVDLQREHKEDKISHNEQATLRVNAKATAIKDVMVVDCQDDTAACGMARAFAGALAAREIASIKSDPYEGKAPTLGTDVQTRALETAAQGIMPITLGVVSVKAIDKDKGSVTNNASDSSTINNSYEENHATSINTDEGQSTATNSPGSASPSKTETPTTSTTVNPLHLSDCQNTSTGAATSGEFSSCMTDYGYSADVISGYL